MKNCRRTLQIILSIDQFLLFLNTKNPRPISAAYLQKTTLDKNFQEKRQENYQKDNEREKKEREIEELRRRLSKLAPAASSSSNLQVN